jgi:hypothetical protein
MSWEMLLLLIFSSLLILMLLVWFIQRIRSSRSKPVVSLMDLYEQYYKPGLSCLENKPEYLQKYQSIEDKVSPQERDAFQWTLMLSDCQTICQNSKIDLQSGKCVCESPNSYPNYALVEDQIKIFCHDTDCSNTGRLYVPDSRQCQCPKETAWQSDQKQCVCLAGNQMYNTLTRQCQECPFNAQFDVSKNTCVCKAPKLLQYFGKIPYCVGGASHESPPPQEPDHPLPPVIIEPPATPTEEQETPVIIPEEPPALPVKPPVTPDEPIHIPVTPDETPVVSPDEKPTNPLLEEEVRTLIQMMDDLNRKLMDHRKAVPVTNK